MLITLLIACAVQWEAVRQSCSEPQAEAAVALVHGTCVSSFPYGHTSFVVLRVFAFISTGYIHSFFPPQFEIVL